MAEIDAERMNAELAGLMRQKLGVGGKGLSGRSRRAGRMMPRWVHRDLRFLAEQETLSGHPRFLALVDPPRFAKVQKRVRAYLDEIDPAERAKDRWLNITAVVAFNFLVLAGLIIAFLAWRGVIGPP